MQQESIKDLRASGNLRKAQLRMVEILVEIDKICRRHQLRYYLDFGSLLGAIRHKGFIPWDDDIDICIYEEDWDKFNEIAVAELPDWLCLQSPQTEPKALRVGAGMVKVVDKCSLYLQDDDVFPRDYTRGCFVDVFKSIRYPRVSHKTFRYLCRRISFAYGFMHGTRSVNLKNIISYFLYPISYAWHSFLLESAYIFGKSNLIHCVPRGYIYGHRSSFDVMFPLSEVEFEGYTFLAPHDPDQRLKDVFGNYMSLPPVEKRRSHAHFIFIDKKSGEVNYEQ